MASHEFSRASDLDSRNVYVLLRWSETLIEIARRLAKEKQPEASWQSAVHARDIAGRVLKLDSDNARALQLLEEIGDEFDVI